MQSDEATRGRHRRRDNQGAGRIERRGDKDGKLLGTAPGKSSDAGKPHKKFGGNNQLAFMTAMFESIQKGLKKQKKSKKRKKRKKRYDSSSSDSDSE
jgi:hypothetical protein